MTVWNSNIPQAGDVPADSQSKLLENNENLPIYLAINHGAFGTPEEGTHVALTMPEVAAAPDTAANECALYIKEGTGTVPQLFFRRPTNGDEIECTGLGADYTRLPSGLLMKWGTHTINGDDIVTVATAPYFTTIYNIQITPITEDLADNNQTTTLKTVTINPTNFVMSVASSYRITTAARVVKFYWMAIGV